MNDDMIINIIWIVGALTLVGGGLMHRGLGQRGALKLAAIWIGIIGAAWGAIVLAQRLGVLHHFT